MRSTLTALSLLLIASSAAAQQGYTAKSLFFAEDDSVVSTPTGAKAAPVKAAAAPAKQQVASTHKPAPKQLGASYFIRLKNADGSQRDVLASRHFQTGERFQLGVKVNRPSYIYILNQEADGKITQIYPQPGRDNFINAMGTVILPAQGAFEFDQKPGTEQLLVYLSPTPIAGQMAERVRTARADVISSPADIAPGSCDAQRYASKGIAFKDDAPASCVAPAYASKGIVFSEDTAGNTGEQAAYVVKTMAKSDNTLYLKLNLVHE